MKLLLIDRDRDSVEAMTDIFTAAGITAFFQPTKSSAIDFLREEKVDAIFFDPAPHTSEVRPFVLAVRRMLKPGPAIVLLTRQDMSMPALFQLGVNDYVMKPGEAQLLVAKARNAHRLAQISNMYSDPARELPNRDGLINTYAFHQLYLASLDRADRYGEISFLIRITIEGGPGLDAAGEALKKHICRIRRLSDIAGNVGPAEIDMLLLRPMREDEPILAAGRFTESLRVAYQEILGDYSGLIMKVTLIELPSGITVSETNVLPNPS